MKYPAIRAFMAAVMAVGLSVAVQAAEPGFDVLFDGTNIDKWEGATQCYEIKNGILECNPAVRPPKGKVGNLVTKKEYRNFVLRFEFNMPKNANNGLGIRIPSNKLLHDAAYHAMCELQLLDDGGDRYFDHKNKRSKLRPYQFTGSVYGIVPAKRNNKWNFDPMTGVPYCGAGTYSYKSGNWNKEEVWVVGSRIRVYLNGTLITDADVSKYKGRGDTMDHGHHPGLHSPKGRIGWLGHGENVKWRNIRIRELDDNTTMEEAQKSVK